MYVGEVGMKNEAYLAAIVETLIGLGERLKKIQQLPDLLEEATVTVEAVRQALPCDADRVTITETADSIKVSPKVWLGEKFADISTVLKLLGAEWISAGRESHWIIPKKKRV